MVVEPHKNERGDKTIDISINLGKLPSKTATAARARRLFLNKKAAIIGSLAIVAIVGAFVVPGLIISSPANTGKTSGQNRALKGPDYKTVVPDGKAISDLGGWKRVSPPTGDPVYAYNDKIDGIDISVSQQPLPKAFQTNTSEQVAELAKKFNATTKLNANDTIVYVGTSSKGPQSAILTKKNLLILIKSQKKIEDDSWVAYAKTLNYLNAPVPNY